MGRSKHSLVQVQRQDTRKNSELCPNIDWRTLNVVTAVYTTVCRRIDVLRHCNDVLYSLGRRYFLKKVVTSCSKCEITYRFSKTFENTYEGPQFSKVSSLQLATLLKTDSFIDVKQRFQRRIHKSLAHSLNLFDKCRQLLIFK